MKFFRDDDDYFTCITKAAEILSNPVKRRAFDSVDPTFDDSVPPEIKSGDKVSPTSGKLPHLVDRLLTPSL